jgi:putative holliday junction resolvase
MKGRTLAIDYGERRLGLALSDEMGIIASGIGTIANDSDTLLRVAALTEERSVQRIIVGLPLTLAGERGASVAMVEAFVEALQKLTPLPVELVDERFTSSLAVQTIRDMGVNRKKRREKGKVDEIAAVILLQGYLDRR